MPDIRENKDMRTLEKGLSELYSRISMILILLTIILIVWFLILLAGVYIWDYSGDWAFLSLNSWILLLSVLIVIFILINFVLYYRLKSFDKKRIEEEKPKPEFIKGRKVHEYTFPKHSEGGIFSRTYVSIDEHNVLRLRILMIKPDELWRKKET